MGVRLFPVMTQGDEPEAFVPFELLSRHTARIQTIHHNSLQALEELGGLEPSEIAAILLERSDRPTMTRAEAWQVIWQSALEVLEHSGARAFE